MENAYAWGCGLNFLSHLLNVTQKKKSTKFKFQRLISFTISTNIKYCQRCYWKSSIKYIQQQIDQVRQWIFKIHSWTLMRRWTKSFDLKTKGFVLFIFSIKQSQPLSPTSDGQIISHYFQMEKKSSFIVLVQDIINKFYFGTILSWGDEIYHLLISEGLNHL